MRFWLATLSMVLLLSCLTAADEPGAEAPAAVAPAQPAGAAAMPIADAIEGVADEDEGTRKASLKRLEGATAEDIPTLEKYADNPDAEIRRQVGQLLKRLKRGELAFDIRYADDKPAAGVKVNVRVFMADQVQVYPNGKQIRVQRKGQGGFADAVISGEYTADAAGRVSIGRYNDGKYLCLVESTDPLPSQTVNRTVSLKEGSKVEGIQFRRGVKAIVTVQDADGAPIPEVKVFNIEDENWLKNILNNPVANLDGMGRQMEAADTDAKGVAVLEKIGLKAVHLVAAKDGYDLAEAPAKAYSDGGTIETTVKLVKTKPVQIKLSCLNAKKNPLVEARVLLVVQTRQGVVMGGNWFQQLSAKDMDQYIERGALDLQTTTATGEVSGTVLPNQYMVLGFCGGKAYWGQLGITRAADGTTVSVMMQELAVRK